MADDPKEKPLEVRSPGPGVEVAREEEERRRVVEIAREIEELGRALDERDRLSRSDPAKKRENLSGISNDVSSRASQLAAIPAIPQRRKPMAESGRLASRRKLWSSLAATIIVLCLASALALIPMGAWIETAQDAYRSAVAQTQRLMVRENSKTEAATPEGSKENTMGEEAEQRAIEQKLAAAVAARQRDEETRQAIEKKARAEAAREMAQARAAAQEAERKAAEEERAVAARRREEENRQVAEEKARAEAAREMAQARAAAREAAIDQTAEDARLKSAGPPRKEVEERSKSDAEVRKQAERAEVTLNLSEQDRKRVQVALNALGHTMPSITGYFGPRTRAMITSWQKTQGLPGTGYLTEAQLATLLQQATPALAKYDQAQRGVKEDPPDTE